jgi:hypothetical protein
MNIYKYLETMKNRLYQILRGEISILDILYFFQGNIRYEVYYSKKYKWFMKNHIREQIEARIKSMDNECYENGQCKLCGCTTTALQMANKSCDKPCYPEIISKKRWKLLKENKVSVNSGGYFWILKDNKFYKLKAVKND